MSDSDGALDAVVPVAAHIPGGGVASISLMLAARNRLEAVEAVVDVLWRVSVVGDSVEGLDGSGSRSPSGRGKGTGVDVPEFWFWSEDAMAVKWHSGEGEATVL